MVEKQIEQFLSATFSLPVVRDVTQTKIEQAIGYSITTIAVNNVKDRFQSLTLGVRLELRSANGYDAIGFLSHKIGLSERGIAGDAFHLFNVSGTEQIEYVDINEVILSKDITIMLRANYDEVAERIKKIIME